MSYSTEDSAFSALPAGVQITYRDDVVRPELRRAAELSVATIIGRHVERVEQMWAADAERAKLADTLNAPFRKLIEADPAAAKALADLRASQLVEADSLNVMDRLSTLTLPRDVLTTLSEDAIEVRVPPYDFTWSWFNQQGSPPFDQFLANETGGVGLVARSGLIEAGASGFVDAHAGFGLFRRTDHDVTAVGRSFRRMRYSFQVRAVGFGSNATSEGGMEFTALEDGRLLASASAELWRSRVSAGGDESASGGEGPFAVHEPSELPFRMRPGHDYTFNVGIRVFTDRTIGAGGAAAQSLMEGAVLALTLQR